MDETLLRQRKHYTLHQLTFKLPVYQFFSPAVVQARQKKLGFAKSAFLSLLPLGFHVPPNCLQSQRAYHFHPNYQNHGFEQLHFSLLLKAQYFLLLYNARGTDSYMCAISQCKNVQSITNSENTDSGVRTAFVCSLLSGNGKHRQST